VYWKTPTGSSSNFRDRTGCDASAPVMRIRHPIDLRTSVARPPAPMHKEPGERTTGSHIGDQLELPPKFLRL
jgi:hypothetical protein